MSEAVAHEAVAEGHDPSAHVVAFKVLVAVWVSLLFLTFLTVSATWVDLGRAALWVALGIATVKGTLVVMYFMHLRYGRPFHAIVFVTALLFVTLFVGLALIDSEAYEPELIPGYAPAVTQK
jgi:cytochrome c oxidase subunit IV